MMRSAWRLFTASIVWDSTSAASASVSRVLFRTKSARVLPVQHSRSKYTFVLSSNDRMKRTMAGCFRLLWIDISVSSFCFARAFCRDSLLIACYTTHQKSFCVCTFEYQHSLTMHRIMTRTYLWTGTGTDLARKNCPILHVLEFINSSEPTLSKHPSSQMHYWLSPR